MFLVFLNLLLSILIWLIFIRVILSWIVQKSENPLILFINDITNPILLPIQKILPKGGMLDFSPFIAVILLDLIKYALNSYLSG